MIEEKNKAAGWRLNARPLFHGEKRGIALFAAHQEKRVFKKIFLFKEEVARAEHKLAGSAEHWAEKFEEKLEKEGVSVPEAAKIITELVEPLLGML